MDLNLFSSDIIQMLVLVKHMLQNFYGDFAAGNVDVTC